MNNTALIGREIKGDKGTYRIIEALEGEGKHGISFRGEDVNGRSVFIKAMKLQENAPLQEIRGRIERLRGYFRAEYEHAPRLVDVEKIAHVLDHGDYSVTIENDEVNLPFLVQEYFEAPNLKTYLYERFSKNQEFQGFTDVKEWIAMATSMLVTLRHIHDCEVVHGDIHPGNFLVLDHEPILIDFGQSLIRDVEQFGTHVPRYDNEFAPPEKSLATAEPWEQPADVFMLGMTLLYMALGTVIPPKSLQAFKNSFDLRDDVMHRFRQRNPIFLNQNECLPHILIQALHKNPHERASSRQLVNSLRSVARLNGIRHEVKKKDVHEKLVSLADIMDMQSATQEDVILASLDTTVSRFRRKIVQAIKHKRVEISGDRNEIINQVLLFLSHLKPGDVYWSLTHPTFWRPYNLGRKGRFYDFNKALARSGVCIRRLFLCGKTDSADALDFAEEVFIDQRTMMVDLRTEGVETNPDIMTPQGIYTGVLVKNESRELQAVVTSGYLIGLAKIGGTYYSMSFGLETEAKVIRRLTIERANKYKALARIETFRKLAADAVSILNFDAKSLH